MGTVEIEAIDRRTINVRFPLAGTELDTLGDMISHASADGYRLEAADSILSGDQRDPYSVGVKLTLVRSPEGSAAHA